MVERKLCRSCVTLQPIAKRLTFSNDSEWWSRSTEFVQQPINLRAACKSNQETAETSNMGNSTPPCATVNLFASLMQLSVTSPVATYPRRAYKNDGRTGPWIALRLQGGV